MTETETTSSARNSHRKVREGIVVSSNMDKTVVVKISRRIAHPLYKKIITKFSKFHTHDEKNEAQVGDLVEIMETRPVSKTKRWRLVRIVKSGELAMAAKEAEAAA
ncbi:MAG: 30S ribosomal protein S17 [Verrucomicrobia bacterium]|jgi:small subunit ribosomal protein S17|nr:30S ribosomal protein S17 [Verrucomicrobiota bacterium]